MGADTAFQDARGIRVAKQIVEELMCSKWQDVEAKNDDRVDGIIFLKPGNCEVKRVTDTGCVVYAQVKCGPGYRADAVSRPDFVGINLEKGYLEKHRPRWDDLPGPVIMIYVDPTTGDSILPNAWWTDLKSDSSYIASNKRHVLFPKEQRFLAHSKGDLIKLCGFRHKDSQLPTVHMAHDETVGSWRYPLKYEAKTYYRQWRSDGCTNPTIGRIMITRAGWRHMDREGRSMPRVLQSWRLLPVARKVIEQVTRVDTLGRASTRSYDGFERVRDFLGLRARVVFPQRDPATVQVVLKRVRDFNSGGEMTQRVWFHSVYEKRRATDGA